MVTTDVVDVNSNDFFYIQGHAEPIQNIAAIVRWDKADLKRALWNI